MYECSNMKLGYFQSRNMQQIKDNQHLIKITAPNHFCFGSLLSFKKIEIFVLLCTLTTIPWRLKTNII